MINVIFHQHIFPVLFYLFINNCDWVIFNWILNQSGSTLYVCQQSFTVNRTWTLNSEKSSDESEAVQHCSLILSQRKHGISQSSTSLSVDRQPEPNLHVNHLSDSQKLLQMETKRDWQATSVSNCCPPGVCIWQQTVLALSASVLMDRRSHRCYCANKVKSRTPQSLQASHPGEISSSS